MINKKTNNQQELSKENVLLPEKEDEKIEFLNNKKENQEALQKNDLELEGGANIKDMQKAKKIQELEAVVHIYSSYNNTIVHVTDMSGRTITKVSGGMVTKQDRLKANPTIAMFIAKRISEKMKEEKIKNLYLRVRAKTRNPAPGPGANAIVKSLSREGFKIINILDNTRIPRGGPKVKGGRRGRRP